MQLCPALTPRQVWAMRLDEAMEMIDARARLMEAGMVRRGSPQAARRAASDDGQIRHLPGGGTARKISSMESLGAFLGRSPNVKN